MALDVLAVDYAVIAVVSLAVEAITWAFQLSWQLTHRQHCVDCSTIPVKWSRGIGRGIAVSLLVSAFWPIDFAVFLILRIRRGVRWARGWRGRRAVARYGRDHRFDGAAGMDDKGGDA